MKSVTDFHEERAPQIMEQSREAKKSYSSPTLTPMTEEQATQFVAQRALLTAEAAVDFLQSLRLQSEANPKKQSAHGHSSGNHGRFA
jgi:hypothetical protein